MSEQYNFIRNARILWVIMVILRSNSTFKFDVYGMTAILEIMRGGAVQTLLITPF